MSRRERENQDSQSTRLYSSRSNREPSPKKTRRDVKQAAERMYPNSSRFNIDTHDHRGWSDRRRPHDTLHPKAPSLTETKRHSVSLKEGSEKKVDMHTQVPRSQPFFQHDERRRYGGHRGQSFTGSKPTDRMEEKKSWRHDGYFELEKNAAPAERKRPAFREKKIEAPSETAEAAKSVNEGREERVRYSRENRSDGAFSRAGDGNTRRGGHQFIERFGGHGGRRGAGNGNGSGPQVQKWKHDLFEDANKSPDPKNEEEEIAKIEALLAL